MTNHPLTVYRERHGLSKTALADLLGTSRANITRWESGGRKPSRRLIPMITGKTGISPRELRPDLVEMIEAAE
jgi:transcriptional regulator with XRE-family HTH domain